MPVLDVFLSFKISHGWMKQMHHICLLSKYKPAISEALSSANLKPLRTNTINKVRYLHVLMIQVFYLCTILWLFLFAYCQDRVFDWWNRFIKLAKRTLMSQAHSYKDSGRVVYHHSPYWCDVKFCAATTASSSVCTRIGTLLQPGDLRIRSTIEIVRWIIAGVATSVFVITTYVGTLSAMVKPRCSLVVPTDQ